MSADFVDWPSIAADDFPFPQAVPTTQLADELSAMLLSPDPEIRDEYAYTAAARWIREGHLDDVLEALGDTAAGRFVHPEVQARTFAPLILCTSAPRGISSVPRGGANQSTSDARLVTAGRPGDCSSG
jgi:hypothetical protein